MQAYLVDVGVLLSKESEEYGAYATAYDKKHGFFDENQYHKSSKEQAIQEALEYVKQGTESTYAVVSETTVPEMSEEELEETPVENEAYDLESVVFSCMKDSGEVKEGFLL